MKKYFVLAIFALVVALLSSACIIVPGDDATLTIANDSSLVLTEIHVASIDDIDYGPDLTGPDVLLPGEEIVVSVVCDTYDALIVDETDFVFELLNLDLCFNDALWVIDDVLLGL